MWPRSYCSETWFLHTRSTTNKAISKVGRIKGVNSTRNSLGNSSSRSTLSRRSSNRSNVPKSLSGNSNNLRACNNLSNNRNVLSSLNNNHTALNNRHNARNNKHNPGSSKGDGYSMAAGRGTITGNKIAPASGKTSIVPGRSAAGTVVTTFLNRPSVSISAGSISFVSAAVPRSIWGIRASTTAAFHSC